jgi:adenosylcobinamide kinase / adenosylcobinamide-phosphate guanylyltransferase
MMPERCQLDHDLNKRRNVTSLLVIGGARSGKSRFAQNLAETSGKHPVLIATAQAFDEEMAERLAKHKAERNASWKVVEEPHRLATALREEAAVDRLLVVDCLTLWLSNRLLAESDIEAESDSLAAAIAGLTGPVVFVSNEVGTGIVPETRLGRIFRDAQGRLNQKIATACTNVVLVSAGLPLVLKPAPVPALQF